jgi:hypothetical protein
VAVKWDDASGGGPVGWVYVGTDRGVFRARFATPGWQRFGTNLPNTLVSDLRLTPGMLTAATHGRGA